MVAAIVRAPAVEALECNLGDDAVDDFYPLAVKAHPTPAYRALHSWVLTSLVDLLHGLFPSSPTVRRIQG